MAKRVLQWVGAGVAYSVSAYILYSLAVLLLRRPFPSVLDANSDLGVLVVFASLGAAFAPAWVVGSLIGGKSLSAIGGEYRAWINREVVPFIQGLLILAIL